MNNSETLLKMIKDNKGYRTENYSGSKVRNICDVIRYEISMGNTDIISYMQNKYSVLDEYNLEPEEIEALKENFQDEIVYRQEYLSKYSDMCQENSAWITDDIVTYLTEQLDVDSEDELTALWLTTIDNAINKYNDGNKVDIDEYLLNHKYLIISDLNIDGALFVFK